MRGKLDLRDRRGQMVPIIGLSVHCQRCMGADGWIEPANDFDLAAMLESVCKRFVKDEQGRFWHRRCVELAGGWIIEGLAPFDDLAVFPDTTELAPYTGTLVTRREAGDD